MQNKNSKNSKVFSSGKKFSMFMKKSADFYFKKELNNKNRKEN